MTYRFRYSLRTLIIVISLFAVGVLVWQVSVAALRRATVEREVTAEVDTWLSEIYASSNPGGAMVELDVLQMHVEKVPKLSAEIRVALLHRILMARCEMIERRAKLRDELNEGRQCGKARQEKADVSNERHR